MSFARVSYSTHAVLRMQERKISRSQVERTLNNPDRVHLSRGKLVAEQDTQGGNLLRVVYVERLTDGGQCAHVVTVVRISGN